LAQNEDILVRKEGALQYLWDQILYIRKSGRPPLEDALTQCGIHDHQPSGIKPRMEDLLKVLLPTFIRHELGEIKSTALDRDLWREIVGTYPGTAIELFARTLKDLLADTHTLGPLAHIIDQRRRAPLAFYIAFQEEFSSRVFPDLKLAYGRFKNSGDWAEMEDCLKQGRESLGDMAGRLTELFTGGVDQADPAVTRQAIQQELVDPLLSN
jgi:hypothetical protein